MGNMKKCNKKKELTEQEQMECAQLKILFNNKKKGLGLTQSLLAERFKMTQPAIGHYLNGINALNAKIAAQFAEALQVSVADFSPRLAKELEELTATLRLPEKGDVSDIHRPMLWSNNTPLPEDEYIFTPFLKESEFTGGAGSFEIPDYNGFRLPFGKSTLYRKSIMPENVFCCTLNGDSMEPRIAENATIAIDTGVENIKDGKIYAFQHGDLFRVKYLFRLPNNVIRIHSENNIYPDETVNGEEIRIIGRVFWWSVVD